MNPEMWSRAYAAVMSGLPQAVSGIPCHPDGAAGVPAAIRTAMEFIMRHQETTIPRAIAMPWIEDFEIIERNVSADELMAFGSACELLRDYFDRHNEGFQKRNCCKDHLTPVAAQE